MAPSGSSGVSVPEDAAAECGLQFFGAVSASISHELKNAIAIVNEHAGLLEDLAALAERGRPVDPKRLKQTAVQIARQVQRADGIIRNMNRFAHSIDDPVKTVDLPEMVCFLAALAERKATMAGVVIDTACRDASFSIQTRPFFLLNLLWICLKTLIEMISSGAVIQLGADPNDRGVGVWLRCESLNRSKETILHAIREQAGPLLCVLNAEVNIDKASGCIALSVPKITCDL
uniref:histidine kinase n=1 Tax=Desulfatirhabdium butyrativorans TaxID=340467 RepID=A0A7C4RLP1_9BACT